MRTGLSKNANRSRRLRHGPYKGNGRNHGSAHIMLREKGGYFRVSQDLVTRMGEALEEAMNPAKMSGPVRTLSDMTKAEIEDLERRYGCQVKKIDAGRDIT